MIDIDVKDARSSFPDVNAFDRFVVDGLNDVGNGWHDKYMEQHFGPGAAARYGYEPRMGEPGSGRPFKGSYAAKKSRKKGKIGPLKWSGQSHRETKIRKFKLTKTRSESSVRVLLPRAFNRRNPLSKIRMQDEIREVLASEVQELGRVFVESIKEDFKEYRG